MRKVEQEMINAIAARKNWAGGNTMVVFSDAQVMGAGRVSLHGHDIAIIMQDGSIRPKKETFRQWPTRTTVSRLRALGIGAHLKDGQPCIDDNPL